jgi:hypothetical protein
MAKTDRTSYEGGREQVYVKHYLLEKYLSSWGYIIGGSEWDSLVFVDGFAGLGEPGMRDLPMRLSESRYESSMRS